MSQTTVSKQIFYQAKFLIEDFRQNICSLSNKMASLTYLIENICKKIQQSPHRHECLKSLLQSECIEKGLHSSRVCNQNFVNSGLFMIAHNQMNAEFINQMLKSASYKYLHQLNSAHSSVQRDLISQLEEFIFESIIPAKYECQVKDEERAAFVKQAEQFIKFFQQLEKHSIFNKVAGIFEQKANRKSVKWFVRTHLNNELLIKKLILFVKLSTISEQFIICASNFAYLLSLMKADLSNQNLQGIRLKNTSLAGIKLCNADLRFSRFDHVDIVGADFTDANLSSVQWTNVHCIEQGVLQGHTAWINSIAYSPDGTFLASGSADSTVRIWDTQHKKELAVLSAHEQQVWSISISPNGKELASASADSTIKIWCTSSFQEVACLSGHTGPVRSVQYFPNGTHLVSGSYDKTVRIWNSASHESTLLDGHTKEVRSVSVSPDGSTVASGGSDFCIILWTSVSGKQQMKWTAHKGTIWQVQFSKDGERISSCSRDKTIKIWSASIGALCMEIKTIQEPKCFAFSQGDECLLSSEGEEIRGYRANTGQLLFIEKMQQNQQLSQSTNQSIALGGLGGSIIIWNFELIQESFSKCKQVPHSKLQVELKNSITSDAVIRSEDQVDLIPVCFRIAGPNQN